MRRPMVYYIFPQQPAEVISMSDVLDGWQEHNQHILNQLRAGKDDEFLLQQSVEDADNGFCTALLRRADLLRLIGNRAHRLIPRCVITQSSGKQRVIDNGDTGGHAVSPILRCQQAYVVQPLAPGTAHSLGDASMD